MLPKQHRLKSPKLFKRALATTPFFRGHYFLVFAHKHWEELPVEQRKATRFGFIISKKVDKRAVMRNKIKRQLREIIRQRCLPEFTEALAPYCNLVILVRNQATGATFNQLLGDLVQSCHRLAEKYASEMDTQ